MGGDVSIGEKVLNVVADYLGITVEEIKSEARDSQIVCAVDMLDYFFFYTRRDAVKCAKHINEKYLNNKAKIWFVN